MNYIYYFHTIYLAITPPKTPLDIVPIVLPVITNDWTLAIAGPNTPVIMPADYIEANNPPATGPTADTPTTYAVIGGNTTAPIKLPTATANANANAPIIFFNLLLINSLKI